MLAFLKYILLTFLPVKYRAPAPKCNIFHSGFSGRYVYECVLFCYSSPHRLADNASQHTYSLWAMHVRNTTHYNTKYVYIVK